MPFNPVPVMDFSVRCLGNELFWQITKIHAIRLPWKSLDQKSVRENLLNPSGRS